MIEARGLATKRQTRTYLTVVVLMCLAGSPGASAQQKPAVDVAAGFQIQPWFGDTDREPSLAGWFVSAARNTGGRGAMEFEYAHGRSDYSFQTVHGLHVVDYDAHSFAAGYRYRLRLGRARPFVRLLVGLSIISDAQGRPWASEPPRERGIRAATGRRHRHPRRRSRSSSASGGLVALPLLSILGRSVVRPRQLVAPEANPARPTMPMSGLCRCRRRGLLAGGPVRLRQAGQAAVMRCAVWVVEDDTARLLVGWLTTMNATMRRGHQHRPSA